MFFCLLLNVWFRTDLSSTCVCVSRCVCVSVSVCDVFYIYRYVCVYVCVHSEHCAKFCMMSVGGEGNFLGDVLFISILIFLAIQVFFFFQHFDGFFFCFFLHSLMLFYKVFILNKVPELNSKFMKHFCVKLLDILSSYKISTEKEHFRNYFIVSKT